MTCALVTFGCRVNQADSLEMEGPLRARQVARKIARENPGAKIVVTGCYATRRPSDLCLRLALDEPRATNGWTCRSKDCTVDASQVPGWA